MAGCRAGTGSDPGHRLLGCTVVPAAPARFVLRHCGRTAPDGLSVLLSSGVGAGAPTPARPRLLSLLAASLLSCLAVAKSFLCRASCAASLLLPLGGKALRQMKSKYHRPTLVLLRGCPGARHSRRGLTWHHPAQSHGASTAAAAGTCLQRSRLPSPHRRVSGPCGCPERRRGVAEAGRQGWAGGRGPTPPAAPPPSPAQRAFVHAQPAGVTPPRERTGRSPAADRSRRAWPTLGACFISTGSRGRGGLAGAGWQHTRHAAPTASAAIWPRCGAAQLRAAGRGLCLGTAPWAIRDPHMAGMDGGCSRGGRHEQQRGCSRGHCCALVPVPCSPRGSGLAVGLAQAVGASLSGDCGGPGLPVRWRGAVLPCCARCQLRTIPLQAGHCCRRVVQLGLGPQELGAGVLIQQGPMDLRSWMLGCCSHGPGELCARLLSAAVLCRWVPWTQGVGCRGAASMDPVSWGLGSWSGRVSWTRGAECWGAGPMHLGSWVLGCWSCGPGELGASMLLRWGPRGSQV